MSSDIRTDAGRPDDSLLAEIEAHAVSVAAGAGRVLMERFGKPIDIDFKNENNRDPVTEADHASDEYLKKAIADKFPGHGVISEESEGPSGSDSPFVWVLDPLDGTTNFMNGLPLFAVSVGVLWNNRPVAGAIWVPASHCAAPGVYHARKGNGAFMDDEKICVRDEPTGRPLAGNPQRVSGGFHLFRKKPSISVEARNLGSIALELALTACGVLHHSSFYAPKLWDAAAGVLLVQEAGGLVYTKHHSRNWHMLEEFEQDADLKPEDFKKTGGWCAQLIAGASAALEKIV